MSEDDDSVRLPRPGGWIAPPDTAAGHRARVLAETLAGLHPTPDLNQQDADDRPECWLRLVREEYDDLVDRPARAGTVERNSFDRLSVEELRQIHEREPHVQLATEAVERATRRATYRRHIRPAIHHGIRTAAVLDRELGDYC